MNASDTARRRRRRVLYLVGVVPSILLLLVSARIALMLHHQGAGLASYDAADFEEAEDHFAGNRLLNPVQRWVAPFAEGGARYRAEDFPGAVTALEVALRYAPEEWECTVRVNLALAGEAVGDEALAVGNRQTAEDAWLEARAVLAGCLDITDPQRPGGEDDPDETEVAEKKADREKANREKGPRALGVQEQAVRAAALRVDERLARKLGPETRLRPPRVDDPPPPEPDAEEREKQLEERNKRALADRVRHQDEFDDDPRPTPEPPPVPQW